MKNKILFTGCLLLFFALTAALISSCNKEQAKSEINCDEQLITVLNPAISRSYAERAPLAPRPGSLEGKTIYLVDLQWGGPEAGYSVFEEMRDWFSRNMPSVKVEVRRSKGGWMGDDPDLRKEIAARAGGAVIGIGG